MTKHEGLVYILARELARNIDSDLPQTVVEEHAYVAVNTMLAGLHSRLLCGMSGAMPYTVKTKYTVELT